MQNLALSYVNEVDFRNQQYDRPSHLLFVYKSNNPYGRDTLESHKDNQIII